MEKTMNMMSWGLLVKVQGAGDKRTARAMGRRVLSALNIVNGHDAQGHALYADHGAVEYDGLGAMTSFRAMTTMTS